MTSQRGIQSRKDRLLARLKVGCERWITEAWRPRGYAGGSQCLKVKSRHCQRLRIKASAVRLQLGIKRTSGACTRQAPMESRLNNPGTGPDVSISTETKISLAFIITPAIEGTAIRLVKENDTLLRVVSIYHITL